MKRGRKPGLMGTRTTRFLLVAQLHPEKAAAELVAAFKKERGHRGKTCAVLGVKNSKFGELLRMLNLEQQVSELEQRMRDGGKFWTNFRDTTGLGRPKGAKDSAPRRKAGDA